MRANYKSEIGLKFNFQHIRSIEYFKKQVPLTEYGYYENYIKRMANGEKNILISANVEYFGHTSGTTGKQKLIPSTKSSRKIASKYMALLTNKFCYDNFKENWNYGKGLMIADIVMTTYTKGGVQICSATSGGMNGILESEFKKGFKGISSRVWPSLTYIATVTGANFSIYDDKVNYYTNSLPIYSTAYAATEAMIGINPYVNKIRYVIIPDTAFYEFIPIKEGKEDSQNISCLHELKIGENMK